MIRNLMPIHAVSYMTLFSVSIISASSYHTIYPLTHEQAIYEQDIGAITSMYTVLQDKNLLPIIPVIKIVVGYYTGPIPIGVPLNTEEDRKKAQGFLAGKMTTLVEFADQIPCFNTGLCWNEVSASVRDWLKDHQWCVDTYPKLKFEKGALKQYLTRPVSPFDSSRCVTSFAMEIDDSKEKLYVYMYTHMSSEDGNGFVRYTITNTAIKDSTMLYNVRAMTAAHDVITYKSSLFIYTHDSDYRRRILLRAPYAPQKCLVYKNGFLVLRADVADSQKYNYILYGGESQENQRRMSVMSAWVQEMSNQRMESALVQVQESLAAINDRCARRRNRGGFDPQQGEVVIPQMPTHKKNSLPWFRNIAIGGLAGYVLGYKVLHTKKKAACVSLIGGVAAAYGTSRWTRAG